MQTNWLNALRRSLAAILLTMLGFCVPAKSQEISLAMLEPTSIEPVVATQSSSSRSLPEAPSQHRFMDRENSVLFATVAATCAADFAVTHQNLANGGRELNPMTRLFSGSTAGLTVNFVGETAGVVGLSYFFHKTGHHKLERLTPLVNVGASAIAVTYGLTHR